MSQESIRVKYYPRPDLAYGIGMNAIENYYPNEPSSIIKSADDAIECYNLYLYLQDSSFTYREWTTETISKYKEYSTLLKKAAYQYFANLDIQNIEETCKALYPNYSDNFLLLLSETGAYKKINKEVFSSLLENRYFLLQEVLENQKISSFFSQEIRKYFDTHSDATELIIESEDSRNNDSIKQLFIPKIILAQRDLYLETYINSDNPSLNSINKIISIKFDPIIPPKIKLLAKKKCDILTKKILSSSDVIKTNLKVEFVKGLETVKKGKISGLDEINISYSLDWLEQYKDFPTIFNNFIYLFEYIDYLGRVSNVFNIRECNLCEIINWSDNKTIYHLNDCFFKKNKLSILSLDLYKSFLNKNGIELEDLITWFFEKYLPDEFNINGMRFVFASKEATYSEKCHSIAASFDNLFKQYYYYVTEGCIDFELISIDSRPIRIQDIPSLLKKKYFYGSGNDYHNIVKLMFSDQSAINYADCIKKRNNSFAALISFDDIKKEDFSPYGQSAIDYLIEKNIIFITDKNFIKIKDEVTCSLLFELYRNGFIEYWNLGSIEQEKIHELAELSFIRFSSNFLSDNEADYFNFIMNKHFSNGLEIRDIYAHGAAQIIADEKIHYSNYLVLMKLLLTFILKINDELCCYDIISKRETK